MSFWSTFGELLWTARTPFLVLAYLLTRALVRFTPHIERYHLRAAGMFVIFHVASEAVAAGQSAAGYSMHVAKLASFAFAGLAIVTIGVTAIFRAVLPRVGLRFPRIVLDLITAAGSIVIFILIGRRAGFSVAGLITTSAVLTAVIGFSLQDTLGNVMGGLSLQLDKSIAVGDWITLGAGQPPARVTEIRWRYTALELRTWDTLIIPNGQLVKSQITVLGRNNTHRPWQRRQVDVYIDLHTSPTEVIDAIRQSLTKDPPTHVARDPVPQVLLLGIKDGVGHYGVRYWLTELVRDDPTDSDVRIRIWFALRRAGISTATPQTTQLVTHQTPTREARDAKHELGQRLRALQLVDLFSGLPQKLQHMLADELVYTPFAAGESVTREGEHDDGLFMIVEGEAVVRLGHGPTEHDVARLGPGQFFGEMSLMTGEARTASVIAKTDLLCYRMNKEAFEHVLRETPSIADQIAEVLVTRKSELTAAQSERDDLGRKRVENAKQDLLGRIRGFFRLDAAR